MSAGGTFVVMLSLALLSSVSADVCHACGYNCDANCDCGRCNTKPGCMNEGSCLGACNAGHNAKWCGPSSPPAPPPTPPSPQPPGPPSVAWSTANNMVQLNGAPVVLHGFGTTCTEYLLRGIGMDCNVAYNWADPAAVLQVNTTAVQPIINYLAAIASTSIVPIVRIPMTASYWLGVETQASKANMDKYPKLSSQYQAFIAKLVQMYTDAGIVAILDLHWSDDDVEQQPMAAKGTSNCITFWQAVASTFGNNTRVFFELYNEPHTNIDQWMDGDTTHAGMLDLLAAVRQHSQNPVIMAGAASYAYDSASLVQIDAKLKSTSETNVIFNFHPYMGPNQAGDQTKCAAGFEQHVLNIRNSTARPIIVTEFGQACCATNGACESCPGSYNGTAMGYDQQILEISTKYGVSWLPWAWRPGATIPDKSCMDLNAGGNPVGTSLAHPTNGEGADFLTLWQQFATSGAGPPPGPPTPGGCPGGSLQACMALCPANPPAVYKACVDNCASKCT
eukprot:m.71573 g.71573  ORF g.71573 m.71573 type:complete len:505 (-) comp10073_c0_seq1:5049-6563(-)